MSKYIESKAWQYQIIGMDEYEDGYVVFACNDLEIAKNKYWSFVKSIDSGFNETMLTANPELRRFELQRIEQIDM